MAREISAGGAVIRRMRGGWWIAVIEPQPPNARRPQQRIPIRALPKGIVDAGEQPEQAAVREVREETGVVAEQVAKLRDIRYIYVRSWGDGARVFKLVSFYLLRYVSGRIGEISVDMRREVRHAEWLPLEEAPQLLTYPGEREVAQLAADYVAAHPDEFPALHSTQNVEA